MELTPKLFWSAALGECKVLSHMAFSANTGGNLLMGISLIRKIQKHTHPSISELIFPSGVMPLDNEQANHCYNENLSFPFEGELWQLAAQNKEAQELTARILKRLLLYIMKFCAHLYSFFETEACLLCLRCTAEAMDL